jgi:hypothetical protein
VINHQPINPETDETSQPVQMQDCQTPVEKSLWRALREARRERDEARREVSKLMGGSAEQNWYANRRGWDCFKEPA